MIHAICAFPALLHDSLSESVVIISALGTGTKVQETKRTLISVEPGEKGGPSRSIPSLPGRRTVREVRLPFTSAFAEDMAASVQHPKLWEVRAQKLLEHLASELNLPKPLHGLPMAVGKTLVFFKLPAFERLKPETQTSPAPEEEVRAGGSQSKVCTPRATRQVCDTDPGRAC